MTVQQVCAGGNCYEFTGVGYAPQGEVALDESAIDPESHPALVECLKAGLLCNDSCLINKGEQWGIEGDPTEVALITAAAKAGLSREALEQELPRIDTLPFESQHQYMATLHAAGTGAAAVIYMKGSVESVLSRCRDAYAAGPEPGLLDQAGIHREVEEMAARGLRVLAFARKVVTAPVNRSPMPMWRMALAFLVCRP